MKVSRSGYYKWLKNKDILNNYGNTSKFLIDETYYRNINVTTSHKNVKIF